MNCPGQVRLSAECGGEDRGTFYSREGTAAHRVAEKCLVNGMDPEFYVGQKIEGVKVSREMASAVRVYVDKVRMVAGATNYTITEKDVEVRVSLEKCDPPEDMFGTVDYRQYDELRGRHLWVIDYKHGQGVTVEAAENEQLMYYALGAVLELNVKPRKITVVIVQPRASHPDGIIRDWTFDWERLVEFKNDLMVAAYATRDEDAPLAVGDWCRFCPALAQCPAQHDHAVEVAQQEFAVMRTDEPGSLPAPHALTEEELLLVLEKGDYVSRWLKAVRDYAFEKLEQGEELPGWKLVPKRANRKWNDEEEVRALLLQYPGVEEVDITKTALISPRQAELLLRRISEELPEGLTNRTPSGYNLAPSDTPAPAHTPGAEFFNGK
jgi:hypothetical protein